MSQMATKTPPVAAEHTTRLLITWILPLAVLLLNAFALWSFVHFNAGLDAANVAENGTDVHTVMKPQLPAVPEVGNRSQPKVRNATN